MIKYSKKHGSVDGSRDVTNGGLCSLYSGYGWDSDIHVF